MPPPERRITYGGETHGLSAWARKLRVPYSSFRRRVESWGPKRAIEKSSEPVRCVDEPRLEEPIRTKGPTRMDAAEMPAERGDERRCVRCGRPRPSPFPLTCSAKCRADFLSDWPHEIDDAECVARMGGGR